MDQLCLLKYANMLSTPLFHESEVSSDILLYLSNIGRCSSKIRLKRSTRILLDKPRIGKAITVSTLCTQEEQTVQSTCWAPSLQTSMLRNLLVPSSNILIPRRISVMAKARSTRRLYTKLQGAWSTSVMISLGGFF